VCSSSPCPSPSPGLYVQQYVQQSIRSTSPGEGSRDGLRSRTIPSSQIAKSSDDPKNGLGCAVGLCSRRSSARLGCARACGWAALEARVCCRAGAAGRQQDRLWTGATAFPGPGRLNHPGRGVRARLRGGISGLAERSCREPITDVDSVKAVDGAVRDGEPGRYHLDEIIAEPLPSGHASRRWGTVIQRLDGALALDLDPSPNR
jgi:hypothetical protein